MNIHAIDRFDINKVFHGKGGITIVIYNVYIAPVVEKFNYTLQDDKFETIQNTDFEEVRITYRDDEKTKNSSNIVKEKSK